MKSPKIAKKETKAKVKIVKKSTKAVVKKAKC